MGGKRRSQPSGDAHGKAASSEDVAAVQGGASQKRQTLGLTVGGAAGSADAGSSGQDESWWMDTVRRVLSLLLPLVGLEGGIQCFHVCKSWRCELEALGFCNKTVQLCSALAEGGDAESLRQNSQRRLNASTDDAERALCLAGGAFLEKSEEWEGSLQEWLQAASQEPDESLLSRGAASTAQSLGSALVQWVGRPQGRYPGSYTLPGHARNVSTVALSRGGKRAVSGSHDNFVKIWNTETGAEVHTLTDHATFMWSVDFSPNGKHLVAGSPDNLVKLWDTDTGAEVCTLSGHSGAVGSVAFSPDGNRVVSGSEDNLVKIWNTETGALLHTLMGHSGFVCLVAFSRDGNRVVSGSTDDLVKIWDTKTGALVHTLTGHSNFVWSVAFSRDGNRIVSGSEDWLVKIWNTETGAEIWSSEGHDCTGRCICTMEEDEDEDEEVVVNPDCPATGHSGGVNRVAFSHDGAQVVSASDDNTVRIFDVASGRQVRQFSGNTFALVEGLSAEHKRDRHVITADGETLRIYEIGNAEQHAEDGVVAAPVACFKAPKIIDSVRCFGATICVGCEHGAVCILLAPILTA